MSASAEDLVTLNQFPIKSVSTHKLTLVFYHLPSQGHASFGIHNPLHSTIATVCAQHDVTSDIHWAPDIDVDGDARITVKFFSKNNPDLTVEAARLFTAWLVQGNLGSPLKPN